MSNNYLPLSSGAGAGAGVGSGLGSSALGVKATVLAIPNKTTNMNPMSFCFMTDLHSNGRDSVLLCTGFPLGSA